jgi:predicted transcriptional regulator
MTLKTVSFRALSAKIDQIDSLAGTQQRDRTFILNEAIDNYLDLHDYHHSLIEQGLGDAAAGRVVSHEKVERQLSAQRKARKSH